MRCSPLKAAASSNDYQAALLNLVQHRKSIFLTDPAMWGTEQCAQVRSP
jgi:hypothetical protein